eukprot:4106818-Amphidinium_carterae.1
MYVVRLLDASDHAAQWTEIADSSRHGARYAKHFGCLRCRLDGSRTHWFATTQDYTTHQRASSHLPLLESLINLGLTMKTFSKKVQVSSAHLAHCGSAGAGKPQASSSSSSSTSSSGSFILVRPPREMPTRGRRQQ